MSKSVCSEDLKLAKQTPQLTEFSVEVAAEAMFTVAPSGCILSANQTACERLEYSRDELVGMRISDIDPHYTPELWPEHFEELRREGKMSFETQHCAKSGRILDVEVSVAYFEFDGVEYCCSSVRDITQRKQAENMLRLQHDVLAMVASTSDGLSETLDKLCELVEKLVPESMATIMLLDESDGCLRFEAGPHLTDEIRAAFEPLVPGTEAGSCGAAAFLKKPVIVPDTRTSPHWAQLQHIVQRFHLFACWSLPILDERNQSLGTFAISHQQVISPSPFHRQILETASHMASIAIGRKRFEQQLQVAHEELSHVSRLSTIGEMASNIAHELNQPLAAMANNAFVLEKGADAKQPEMSAIRKQAADIRGQALRAGDIISSLRNLAKKSTPSRASADLNQIIRKSLVLLDPELRQFGVQVEMHLEDTLPMLLVDAIQIQQVIVNLVRNAIEAMKGVRREDRILALSTSLRNSDEVELRVLDTGTGLQDADCIFDAFHTTKREGMGMGLTISRSIVEAHSGRLFVDEAIQRGAAFCVVFPRHSEGDACESRTCDGLHR